MSVGSKDTDCSNHEPIELNNSKNKMHQHNLVYVVHT